MNVKIIFGTITGNSQMVAEKLKSILSTEEATIDVLDSLYTSPEIIEADDTVVFITSTWNFGDVNDSFINFYNDLDKTELEGVRVAFIGLGDMLYGEEAYCKAMYMLREKILRKGGLEIIESFLIDGPPDQYFNGDLQAWAGKLITNLKS